ncbi:hypothetical protein [Pseudobacteriovorax antillogorgiicola]|uniref:Lipoprotein n=1 Tax=Pseudobacteriovorax antillogorgiicola TaxID=1513793 RepID=A0A1Y6BD84_9BACT|nr:hypothetical protein [Pseudobacteriovorax antillogorgiicola]TCS56451.1 hypothetical protein EDD56_104273 [Pseudobacteriovorax antillogorgiicola]SMF05305.1 hypothetical protein SAMN06296036_10460 [Pseudobacteriovorax antillogorgiicola]
MKASHSLLSLSILFIFACQPKNQSNLASYQDPECASIPTLAPEPSVVIADLEKDLVHSGLSQPESQALATYILNNREEYTSLVERIRFNQSEAGCGINDESTLQKLALHGLNHRSRVNVFQGEKLKIVGVSDPRVTSYVQVFVDFYWDSGVYWFVLSNLEDQTSADRLIIEHGVDD